MTHSECVLVASVARHAMRMRRIILSSVACLVLQYIYALSKNKTAKILENKDLLKIKCVLIFFTGLSEIFLVQSDII